jgi:hypothetical protein
MGDQTDESLPPEGASFPLGFLDFEELRGLKDTIIFHLSV